MELRIQGLAAIDLKAVHLPVGTEVSTRVDRAFGERIVPQGAVGRVMALDGQDVDVHLVGIGVLRYPREALLPRKVGQLRYAARRDHAWSSLRDCVIVETVVGSRAWGLAHEHSDTDRRGVFSAPFTWTHGLVEPPEDLVSADGSDTFWAHEKAIRQAIRCDPNTLEALFVQSATPTDELGQWLLSERDAFVSTDIYGTFGRYAMSQLDKLSQNLRLANHRTEVLSWLQADPSLSLDAVAQKLALISPRAAASEKDALLAAKQYIKQLYRSMCDQGLIAHASFDSLTQFALQREGELPEPSRELRPKNAYNLLRLIHVATHWLRVGEPDFVMSGAFRERLLAIKQGHVALSEVIEEAESMTPALVEAWTHSKLPKQADVTRADRLLRRMNSEIAARSTNNVPGPWGVDAAPFALAQWDLED
ncbi:MAG: nucleotidyltransferase domain-containing protein [Deltaproteobacteria bacterium]|nr:nucleotidyltransferase domain-containing protein [Deltaproteobacteria bacterium]